MDKVAEIFESIVPILAAKARTCMDRNEKYGDDSVLSVILEAYNQMQEDEFDGHYYIFSIHNEDDLKCLVKNGMTASEISFIYQNYENGSFRFDDDGNKEEMTMVKIRQTLANNMDALVRCVLMYPEVYKKVYNLLVADSLVSSDDILKKEYEMLFLFL